LSETEETEPAMPEFTLYGLSESGNTYEQAVMVDLW
jgi:hypothetical protein